MRTLSPRPLRCTRLFSRLCAGRFGRRQGHFFDAWVGRWLKPIERVPRRHETCVVSVDWWYHGTFFVMVLGGGTDVISHHAKLKK